MCVSEIPFGISCQYFLHKYFCTSFSQCVPLESSRGGDRLYLHVYVYHHLVPWNHWTYRSASSPDRRTWPRTERPDPALTQCRTQSCWRRRQTTERTAPASYQLLKLPTKELFACTAAGLALAARPRTLKAVRRFWGHSHCSHTSGTPVYRKNDSWFVTLSDKESGLLISPKLGRIWPQLDIN